MKFYKHRSFNAESLGLIARMNAVIADYVAQGYRLTVRQLYYQLVAGAVIANTERSYKRITSMVNDAKLAGIMDWEAIEDRTREFIRRARWESTGAILQAVAEQFHMDMWENQLSRVFVVVEKEALVGVLERVCRKYDAPILAARGFPSGTVLREFGVEDMMPALESGQNVIVLHFGDHDPSGIDMTRDLKERIAMFCEVPEGQGWELKRIALTLEQIKQYNPPPNPAKTTDARFAGYERAFGDESWELDALKPEVLTDLISHEMALIIDEEKWEEKAAEVVAGKNRLLALAKKEAA